MPRVQLMLDQCSGLKTNMAPDDSSINQKVLMPKTSSEVYEGIQNFCSVFYDGYMGFIPNECFADKRMLV